MRRAGAGHVLADVDVANRFFVDDDMGDIFLSEPGLDGRHWQWFAELGIEQEPGLLRAVVFEIEGGGAGGAVGLGCIGQWCAAVFTVDAEVGYG